MRKRDDRDGRDGRDGRDDRDGRDGRDRRDRRDGRDGSNDRYGHHNRYVSFSAFFLTCFIRPLIMLLILMDVLIRDSVDLI
jgi:hypothetical protein